MDRFQGTSSYILSDALREIVNAAIVLKRPLLLKGEPGTGKTELAQVIAEDLDLRLIRWNIKSTSKASEGLYVYDTVQRLNDSRFHDKDVSDIRQYIKFGKLGEALRSEDQTVLLIDEIDKADIDFPNDLVWEIDRLDFRVNEAPEMHFAVDVEQYPGLRPIIFVTNNEEKALPTAFLRRCIFHYLYFPDDEKLLEHILALHDIKEKKLSKKATQVLLRLRQMEQLKKKPGISELIDWVGYLQAAKASVGELDNVPYIGALLKNEYDRQQVKQMVQKQSSSA